MSNQSRQLRADGRIGLPQWIPALLLGGIVALNLIGPLWDHEVIPPRLVLWVSFISLAVMMVDLWHKVRVSARFP